MASKIKKLWRILSVLVLHPQSLVNVIDDEAQKKVYVMKKHGHRYGLQNIDLLDLFPDFEETVKPYSFLEGTSLPIDLALLRALARQYKPCRYLEIGTWRGESVANVADIADECVSINLSEDEMRKLKYSGEFIRNCGFFSNKRENILHIGHNSLTFDFSTFKEKFDLIFVDGDHSYESVKSDTQNAFQLLRNRDSVIVWHDYGFTPEHIRWPVLAGILDGCPEEKRDNLYHISNTLCAIYMNGNFKTTFVNFPQIPNKCFTVKMSATKLD